MLNEDTKIDLSGEIDSNPATEAQEGGSKGIFGGMSLPVPINISQVKKYFLMFNNIFLLFDPIQEDQHNNTT